MTTQTQNLSELVAENVRALMARTKTKQSGLADVLHMTQGAVSKKGNGDRPFSPAARGAWEETDDVA